MKEWQAEIIVSQRGKPFVRGYGEADDLRETISLMLDAIPPTSQLYIRKLLRVVEEKEVRRGPAR